MNAAACQRVMEGVGSGVAASLRAVDCASSQMAQAAFGRLFGSGGALVPALTILLTLFVALFAFALITGRSRVGISSLTPRIVTLGLVLTFATSWIAYQSVVWNLATGTPNQLASILTGTPGNAVDVFAQKIDVVIAALERASGNGTAPSSTFSPLGLMWLGGILLLLGTVGVLATARIALAVLIAIGPVFVVLALFPATRGLFAGWMKAVVLLALAPLFAVLSGSLMLELAVPVLSSLAPTLPGQIDTQAAMALFMIGAVHMALMVLVTKVVATMVAGWSVFGLATRASSNRAEAASAARIPGIAAPTAATAVDRARADASAASRQIRLAPSAPLAANDPEGTFARRREIRLIGPAELHSPSPLTGQYLSRARGIGSRFRAAPARHPEKLK